jgi:uncharacterized protein with HEPN domain
MPHSAPVLLEDIRHAAQRILDVTSGRTQAEYGSDDYFRAAVERWFIVIGEALSRLEKLDVGTAQHISEYRKIIGFRKVLVHGYDAIDDQIVWDTIQQHLPVLKQEVEELLAKSQSP